MLRISQAQIRRSWNEKVKFKLEYREKFSLPLLIPCLGEEKLAGKDLSCWAHDIIGDIPGLCLLTEAFVLIGLRSGNAVCNDTPLSTSEKSWHIVIELLLSIYVSTLHSSFMPLVNPFCRSIANGDIEWLLGVWYCDGTLRFSLDLQFSVTVVQAWQYSDYTDSTDQDNYMEKKCDQTIAWNKDKRLTWNLQDSCLSWSISRRDCCL